jgi:hypothetical protein
MNINMYVINAILILMVIPVLAVGCAAVLFLHSVPGGGNDAAAAAVRTPAGIRA